MPKASQGVPRRQIAPSRNVRGQRAQRQAAKEAADAAPDTIVLTLAEHKGRLRGEGRHGDGRKDVVKPTTKEFGNSLGDRAWLEAAREAGFIEDIGPDEEEIPAGAIYRYTGPMLASKRFWNWPQTGRFCSSTAFIRDEDGHYVLGEGNFQLRRPCSRTPILGGDVCVPHGGGIERVRRKAEMRLLGAADTVIGALITIALDVEADTKARVQAINSILDRAQIKGVTQVEVDIPAYREVMKASFPTWSEANAEEDGENDDDV